MNLHVKTVLVVDDEPVLRTIVREILNEEGYAVIEAADGRGCRRSWRASARIWC